MRVGFLVFSGGTSGSGHDTFVKWEEFVGAIMKDSGSHDTSKHHSIFRWIAPLLSQPTARDVMMPLLHSASVPETPGGLQLFQVDKRMVQDGGWSGVAPKYINYRMNLKKRI